MKKIVGLVLSAILLISLAAPTYAAGKGAYVFVDGRILKTFALNKNGAFFVPFRAVFEQLGVSITYDAKTKRYTGKKKGISLSFSAGSKTALVNGKKTMLTGAPFVQNGTTYIPLRFAAESTGNKAYWTKEANLIHIVSPSFKGVVYDVNGVELTMHTNGTVTIADYRALEEELVYYVDISVPSSKHETSLGTPKNACESAGMRGCTLSPEAVIVKEQDEMGEAEKKFREETNNILKAQLLQEMEDEKIKSDWIGDVELEKKIDVLVTITKIDKTGFHFTFYSPYTSDGRKEILNIILPADWQDEPDHDEVSTNGIRVKRSGGYAYYNVEDLYKLTIIPLDYNDKIEAEYKKRIELITSPRSSD